MIRTYGISNTKNYDSIAKINKLENNGLIDVFGEQAIGIYNSGELKSLINNGKIYSLGTKMISAGTKMISAGIYMTPIKNKTQLKNDGIIEARDEREDKSKLNIYGISGQEMENLINNGVVFSDRYTIHGANANATNNGLLIGDSSNFISNSYINNGMMFSWNKINNNYKIQGVGNTGIKSEDKTIINAILTDEQNKNQNNWTATESESIVLEDNKTDMIYNGITNTLKVNGEKTLTNSIVNGYTSAIVFNENGGSLTLDNSIINGGIDETSATIKGSNNIDNLTLTNGTIINGNTDLGNGNDNLTLDDKTQINGDLLGGDGVDTLTFNNSTTKSNDDNIIIFGNIDSFENMDIDTNVTFFENSKVTGTDSIKISSDGNLILRIDSTNGNSHALSGNTGTISSEGGKLLLALNGVGEGETISFGGTSLDETMKGNEEGLKETTIDTTSLLHNIEKINDNSVKVTTVSNIPYVNNMNYSQLNKIYQSIRITDQVKEFNITDDKTLTEFTKYLNDIYAGTPYSYSTEISRKTLTMFDEIAISKDLNPDLKSWAIYGGLTHTDGGTKDTYYGKGYYTYDVGSIDIDADTKIYGGYAKAEYGKSENFTTGLIFGGNNSEVSLSNGSKLEGDSFYFGVYGKQKFGNLKLTAGIGVQHGDYKADRKANGYSGITTTREFSENYHDRGFNIYLDGRYSYALGNNFFLEPRMTVDYNRIQQDEVSEKGVLGIEVDSKIFETSSGTVGLDIKKVIPTETFNHELTLGVSYNTFFSGDKEEYLTGRFVGGSNFDMLVGEKADRFSLNGSYEIATEKGLSFDVRGNYAFEHENSKDEWTVGMGIGYKF